ncbi:hypothetical protein F5X99DRAFT_386469 [Biscogniauxia marginata]|nr:hypothetical protein F5X99DRAFT_386469 [Biscogniauxia marginata]
MTAPSEPRVRAKKPKVRTGCINCKSRRIKCDEGQPACLRCLKARLACRYDPSKLKPGDGRPLRAILPAAQLGLENDQNDPLLAATIKSSNLSATEAGYFDAFRNSVVQNLCLNGYTNLWSQTMLRESMRDECIRDCVLGIGALYRALLHETQRGPALIPLWRIPLAGKHTLSRYHRDAIQYYTSSLSKFRTRLSSEASRTKPRTILIASILFLVYEVMQGNCEAVDRVAHKALVTLKDNLGSLRPNLDPRLQVGSALDDEGVREADYFLLRLVAFGACCSPLYASQWESNAYENTWPLKSTVPEWKSSTKDILAAFDRFNTSGLVWGFRTYQGTVVGYPTDPMRLQKGQATVISQAQEWCRFTQEKLRQETDPEQRKTWAVLLSGAKIQTIFGGYYEDKEEEERIWDSRAGECHEAISLVESIMDSWDLPCGFPPLFEDKVFPVIRGVVTRCRDRQARFKALELCRRLVGPWWENRTILIGYEALVAFEEAARDEHGYIPLKSRYQWVGYSWNEDHTEITLTLKGVVTAVERQLTVRLDEDLKHGQLIGQFHRLPTPMSPDKPGNTGYVLTQRDLSIANRESVVTSEIAIR